MLVLLGCAPLWAESEATATLAPERGVSTPAPACEEGQVLDDGSLETGYGWVPTVIEGQLVQTFPRQLGRVVDSVCVCWLRTAAQDTIDYDLVFYSDAGGLPALDPYFVQPSRAEAVPAGIVGQFYEIDVPEVAVPSEKVYVGVRWDASAYQFFFVCADKSPATPPAQVFFREERFPGWGSALDTPDPTFNGHRAILVRTTTVARPDVIPTLHTTGLVLLVLGLAVLAVSRFRSRDLDPPSPSG